MYRAWRAAGARVHSAAEPAGTCPMPNTTLSALAEPADESHTSAVLAAPTLTVAAWPGRARWGESALIRRRSCGNNSRSPRKRASLVATPNDRAQRRDVGPPPGRPARGVQALRRMGSGQNPSCSSHSLSSLAVGPSTSILPRRMRTRSSASRKRSQRRRANWPSHRNADQPRPRRSGRSTRAGHAAARRGVHRSRRR